MARLNCPQCGRRFTLRTPAAQKAVCSFCRQTIAVPAVPEALPLSSESRPATAPVEPIVVHESHAEPPTPAAEPPLAPASQATLAPKSRWPGWFRATWVSVTGSVVLGLCALVLGYQLVRGRIEGRSNVKTDMAADEQQDSIGPDKAKGAVWSVLIIERLNHHRKQAGLRPVVLDAKLTEGCVAHANYLARNVAAGQAAPETVYHQSADKPGYSAAGQKTARTALVAFSEPTYALERWMGRLFSRVLLLKVELQSVGIGWAQTADGGWVCVVDAVHGRGEEKSFDFGGAESAAVLCPAPDQKDVPRHGFDRLEETKAGGFPISVTFPRQTALQGIRATLTDSAGAAVKIRVSTPQQPLNPKLQRANIALHPLQPLQARASYTVEVAATVNGVPWRQRWRFTTSN